MNSYIKIILFLFMTYFAPCVYAEKEVAGSASSSHAGEGYFGDFRIGPMVGYGFVLGPNVSIESKFGDLIGFSLSYSHNKNINIFQYASSLQNDINSQSDEFQVNSINMNYKQVEGKVSIFPFEKSFFIGLALGQRYITIDSLGSLNSGIPTLGRIPFDINVNITSIYATPQIGWLVIWDGSYGGFAIGTELGVQFSLQSTVTDNVTFTSASSQPYISEILASKQYSDLNNQLNNTIHSAIQNYPLPYWNFLKIGWLF